MKTIEEILDQENLTGFERNVREANLRMQRNLPPKKYWRTKMIAGLVKVIPDYELNQIQAVKRQRTTWTAVVHTMGREERVTVQAHTMEEATRLILSTRLYAKIADIRPTMTARPSSAPKQYPDL